jgi:zinc transport system ATP-binding protein
MNTTAVEVRDVSLAFNEVPVLEEISLTLEQGDFLGIIGPNGGGKTTLLRVILGLVKPDRGDVRVFGKPPSRAHGEVGYVPQYARFDASFPIDVLEVVLMGRLSRGALFSRVTAEDREAAQEALVRVQMADLASRQIGELSGGQLQRVLVARALAVEPRILLLDEPTASIDTPIGRSVYELLEDLAREKTVVLVSHDIGVISRYVKTVACLNRHLHYHHSKELTSEMVEAAYGCPVELLGHGHPHRVLEEHPPTDGEGE